MVSFKTLKTETCLSPENQEKPTAYKILKTRDVKNGQFEYFRNQNDLMISIIFFATLNIWSFLVSRCLFLIQKEHGHSQKKSHLITKILQIVNNPWL